MAKKKVTPPKDETKKPAQLTYGQIRTLASGLATDLMGHEGIIALLLVFMDELMEHSFDHSQVETISVLLSEKLFAVTVQSNRAEKAYTAQQRRKLLAQIEGK